MTRKLLGNDPFKHTVASTPRSLVEHPVEHTPLQPEIPPSVLPPMDVGSKPQTLRGDEAIRQPSIRSRSIAHLFFRHYWRLAVFGEHYIPKGPVLIVANQTGPMPFNGMLILRALSQTRPDLPSARWLCESELLRTPLLGKFWTQMGASESNPEQAWSLLEKKLPVICFPEGHQGLRKSPPEETQLKTFGRGGYLKIAMKAKCPILPAAIIGAKQAWPFKEKTVSWGMSQLPTSVAGTFPKPSNWFVRFGPPIEVAVAEPADHVRIQRLNDEVRSRVGDLLIDLETRRPSVSS